MFASGELSQTLNKVGTSNNVWFYWIRALSNVRFSEKKMEPGLWRIRLLAGLRPDQDCAERHGHRVLPGVPHAPHRQVHHGAAAGGRGGGVHLHRGDLHQQRVTEKDVIKGHSVPSQRKGWEETAANSILVVMKCRFRCRFRNTWILKIDMNCFKKNSSSH